MLLGNRSLMALAIQSTGSLYFYFYFYFYKRQYLRKSTVTSVASDRPRATCMNDFPFRSLPHQYFVPPFFSDWSAHYAPTPYISGLSHTPTMQETRILAPHFNCCSIALLDIITCSSLEAEARQSLPALSIRNPRFSYVCARRFESISHTGGHRC